MRLTFTGGGTGGHILPAFALIDELRDRLEISYIGEKNGLEERMCAKQKIPFYGISAGKLRRYWDFKNFADAIKIPIGFFQALKILKHLKPDLVFAKGGYVSVPVSFAAFMLRIPVFLHESDLSPGLASKAIAAIAKKIFLSFPESEIFFKKYKNKTEVTGSPVREKIFHGLKEKGYSLTGFSSKLPIVLVMGGSTGAKSLNELVWSALPELMKFSQIIHITGPAKMTIEISGKTRYQAYEYVDEELAHLYAISDVIVSRAGASSISEILVLRKPNILVPLGKHASRGDQIQNAEMCRKHGWSEIFYEDKDSKEKFIERVKTLLRDQKKLESMKESMSLISVFLKESRKRLSRELIDFQVRASRTA